MVAVLPLSHRSLACLAVSLWWYCSFHSSKPQPPVSAHVCLS